MKKLLFIIPCLKTGGSRTALSALYSNIKDYYSIDVFSISHEKKRPVFSFDSALLNENKLLSLIYSDYSQKKGIDLFLAVLLKVSVRLGQLFGFNLSKRIELVASRTLECQKYDYVISYEEGTSSGFASLLKCPNKVAWIHSDYSRFIKYHKEDTSIYRCFNKIVCVSQYTAAVFCSLYPEFRDKTISIYNLLDTQTIFLRSRERISNPLFKQDRFVILSVGRFSPVKRFRAIPGIAQKLVQKGLSFYWYIIGPMTNIEEMEKYKQSVEFYGVEDVVVWIGEELNPYPYFLASNLYVCTSESEACPMVFNEAKLLGKRIVTTNFPSAKEFILDNNEGAICSLEELPETISNEIINRSNNNCIGYNSDKELSKIKQLFV